MPGARGGHRLGRLMRGMRPDRNPLRRGTDRLETYLLAGLLTAAAAGTPVAALTVSHAAYSAALQTRQQEIATRFPALAVLSQKAGNSGGYTLTTAVPAPATWTSAGGTLRSGDVPARIGSPQGTIVPVWTTGSGYLSTPPIALSQVAGEADAAVAGVLAGSAAACVVLAAAIRCGLDRRRIAAWEADWRVTAPAWNRQRW